MSSTREESRIFPLRMKNSNYHTHFPLKRCLIASVVILLCARMVLGLLYAIVKNENIPDKTWIFVLVWGVVFFLRLFTYWRRQIIQFIRTRKDENKK